MKLIIVDFDGTLADSPSRPKNWQGKWWRNIESLVETPEFNHELANNVRSLLKEHPTKSYVMTGRMDFFEARIEDILTFHGFLKNHDYDRLICQPNKTYVNTDCFKKEALRSLLYENKETKEVVVFDDKNDFREPFQLICNSFGVKLTYNQIKFP